MLLHLTLPSQLLPAFTGTNTTGTPSNQAASQKAIPSKNTVNLPKASSSNSGAQGARNVFIKATMWWLAAAGLVKSAKADLLTLDLQGNPGVLSTLSGSLASTLERTSQEKVHTISVPGAFVYPRSLLCEGPNGRMVMPAPDSIGGLRAGAQRGIQAFLKEKNIPYTEISAGVNMADILYDQKLDLLVIAHSMMPQARNCESDISLHPECADKVGKVITAFGNPKNIVQLFKNPGIPNHNGGPKCYDLDIFFHLTTNTAGQKIALIYRPCIMRSRALDNARKDMALKSMITKFKELGITLIDLSRDDFNRLAANAVSLEPGKIVFSDNISEELKQKLRQHEMEPIIPEIPIAIIEHPRLDDFGAHCITANIPNTEKAAASGKDKEQPHDEL